MDKDTIFDQEYAVDRKKRERLLNQKPLLFWFTGLSGSGKSTIANALEHALHNEGLLTYSLDGDNIRKGLNADLGFSAEDRKENVRRIAECAKLFLDAGVLVMAAFVSPFEKDRAMVKDIVGAANYVEVYVATSLEICEQRDIKGLYARARKGEIPDFTGISAPYEKPVNPDIIIDTEKEDIATAVEKIRSFATLKN